MFSDPTLTTENDGPKLRGFRDSLVNDKLENNNMATAASSGTISRRPHLLDNAPNYLGIWVNYPKEILNDIHMYQKPNGLGVVKKGIYGKLNKAFLNFLAY